MVLASPSTPSPLTLNLFSRVMPLARWVLLMTFGLGLALGLCATMVTAQTRAVTTATLAVTSGGTAVSSVTSGSVVTLTARVNAGATAVTPGQVNFCDASAKFCTDIHLLGMAQLTSAGTATLKLRPGIGTHGYTAVFVGTRSYSGSSSTVSSLTVTGTYATSTTIQQTGQPGNYALTATVVGVANLSSAPAPSGQVSFIDTTSSNVIVASGALGSASKSLQFLNSSNPATVTQPNAVAAADFNGDGIPDLAVSNSNSGATELTILLGNGDGTFRPLSTSPTVGLYPDSIAVGDFNGDGIPDLAISSVDDNLVTILLGKGDGTFTSPPALSTSSTPQSVATGDFNGDGIPDLAVVNASSVLIFLGKGDGTFTLAASSPSPGPSAITVATGDFNQDGILDLAVTNGTTTGLVTILLGNGDGTFRAGASPLTAGTSAVGLTVADFNGDGKLDLATTNYESSGVNIFLGNGDGTFQTSVYYPAPDLSARSVLAADFNGDGIPDLAVGQFWSNASILLGKGDGTFGTAIPLSMGILASGYIAAADFNGDGIPDLVEPNQELNGTAVVQLVQPSQAVMATVTNVSLIGPGPHLVEANYPGDSNYGGSVSATTSLVVVAATPGISPTRGTYSSAQTLTITDATPGATIYYSAYGPVITNGFVPYTGPVPIATGGIETVTAYATAAGYQQSGYATVTFTLNLPPAPAPTFSPATGSFSGPQTVTISDTALGATIYYTTDGTIPTTNSAIYHGPITVSTTETIAAIASAIGYRPSNAASAQYFLNSSVSSFVYTIAGAGSWGYSGDGGLATSASLNYPLATVVDKAGNVYVADTDNNVVRKIAVGTGIITTIVGTAIAGYSGDNGQAVSAQLSAPVAVAIDGSANLYIAEQGNRVVRMVAANTGIITTYAGNPTATTLGDGGPATSAQLFSPNGLAFDNAGNLYISDSVRIREVTASTGIITTVAGNGILGYSGDNGPATAASFGTTEGISFDANGNLYIADMANNDIRKVTASTGIITTVAGATHTGGGQSYGGDGGPAINALLNGPFGIVVDTAGNLFIADSFNYAVREVTASNGIINTILGHPPLNCSGMTGDGGPAIDSAVCQPKGLTFDNSGNLLVAESTTEHIRKVTTPMLPPTLATATPTFDIPPGTYASPQTVHISDTTPGTKIYLTLNGASPNTAGNGYSGAVNVTGSATLQAIAVAPGYLPSTPAMAVYTITAPPAAVINTIAGGGVSGQSGAGGQATSAELAGPNGLAFDANGNLYIADSNNSAIWAVDSATGTISVAAGTPGVFGYSGDGGPATSAVLNAPSAIAFDKAGNLYISDSDNNLVRVVSVKTGIISVYAGVVGFSSNLGDGGPATSASLFYPEGIAFDSAGNLYIADSQHLRIRMVSASTGIISTVAGGGTSGTLGDGGPATSATLVFPGAAIVDPNGNLYIADGARVRFVNAASGVITSIAGNGDYGDSGDGGPPAAAEIYVFGLALDKAGNVYLANWPNVVRMLPVGGGAITTVAGNGYRTSGGDGGAATMAGLYLPAGLAFDASGNLYIADKYNQRVREVSFSGLPTASTPSFSLAAGTYAGAQTIAITDVTPGAVIYYTIDGSTPTMSATVSLYSGPFALSSTATVMAFAAATGYTQSSVASANYLIKGPVSPVVTWPTPADITYGTALSSAQLDAVTPVAGTFTYSPPIGTVLSGGQHTLTATFTPADTTNYAAVTANVTLTVNVTNPSVSVVASSLNPAFLANSVTLTVTVTGSVGTPGGTISFMDGTAQLGSGSLNGGTATYTTSTLTVGSHSITAVYSGDSNFAPQTSAALSQIVESFTIATSSGGSSSATASAGGQATYSLAVNPPTVGTALTFSVTGLPAGATASFSPATVPAGSAAANVILTVSLPSTAAIEPISNPLHAGTVPFALGLLVLPLAGIYRKASQRFGWTLLLALVTIAGIAVLNACGGGGGAGRVPPPSNQTYTLTVSANSASLVQSIKLTLIVQ